MTLRFVLDTNICIFAIKNKPGAVRQALNRRPGSQRKRDHRDGTALRR